MPSECDLLIHEWKRVVYEIPGISFYRCINCGSIAEDATEEKEPCMQSSTKTVMEKLLGCGEKGH